MFQEYFAKLIYFISESSLNVQTLHFKSYKNEHSILAVCKHLENFVLL